MRRTRAFAASWARAVMTALLPGAFVLQLSAQTPMDVKGFKVADYGTNGTEMVWLLEGERAHSAGNNQYLLTNATLQVFGTRGEHELLMKAPESLYQEGVERSLRSSGPLHLELGQGTFNLDGDGFLWQQDAPNLSVSNHVHSTILVKDVNSHPGAPASSGTNRIEITSQAFQYSTNSGTGIYSGHVQLSGMNLRLSSEVLRAVYPVRERQLLSLTAETNVVMDFQKDAQTIHTTSGLAEYTTTNGLLSLSGHPLWKGQQHEGGGEVLILDRTNSVFFAHGQAWLRLHSRSQGGALLPGMVEETGPAKPVQERVLEVFADDYELRTNSAAFHGHVRATEFADGKVAGTLNSAQLTATFVGTNQLERLVAQEEVVIAKEDNRFTASKAVYTAANGLLELTGNPKWQAGTRSGAGDLIIVRTNEMTVRGHAMAKLPASEFSLSRTNGGATAKSSPALAGKTATVTCQQYILTPGTAFFSGDVFLDHPEMKWHSGEVTAHYPPGAHRAERILAEQGVVFDLLDPQGRTVFGKGDQADYHFNATTNAVELSGNPASLTWISDSPGAKPSTNSLTIPRMLYNLNDHTLKNLPGSGYRITGSAPVDTNKFALPKNKLMK